MDVYLVGGAIRDELLGRPVTERDWLVVGATPQEMIRKGYRPVGKDFPVFLHPQTGEEYALARTERKDGHGHQGFRFHAAPDVTLEQDLVRRDLTINAMAKTSTGRIIDPHNGRRDLAERTLRHVSDAFTEDPLRVLRVARFAARYQPLGFRVAADTLALMRQIASDGELRHLTPERAYQELARALLEPAPQVFLTTLQACGALAEILPEIAALVARPQPEHDDDTDAFTHLCRCLVRAAEEHLPLPACYALLAHNLAASAPATNRNAQPAPAEQAARCLSRRLRVPGELQDAAILLVRWQHQAQGVFERPAADTFELLHNLDALRRPARLATFLAAAQVCARVTSTAPDGIWPQAEYLHGAARALRAVSGAALHEAGLRGPALGRALQDNRIAAIRVHQQEFIDRWKQTHNGLPPS